MSAAATRVAVVLASHNRRAATLECLAAIGRAVLPSNMALHVILVDDGSSDGTEAAVVAAYPEVRVLRGDGSLYWNGGMRVGCEAAVAEGCEFILLLNDDVVLAVDFLRRLSDVSLEFPGAIVVGAMEDPDSGLASYGGWRHEDGRNRLQLRLMGISSETVDCDTFNGNCVLIPLDAYLGLGGLDRVFTHGMADLDLGLRARRLGIRVLLAPGSVGMCRSNTGRGMWTDARLSAFDRWQMLLGPKGLPPGEWLVFTFRHAGILWPLHWLSPYFKFWLSVLWSFVGLNRR